LRRSLPAVFALLALVAVLLAVSGGFRVTVGGLRLSARSPWPAATLALVALGVWFLLARAANKVAPDLELAWSSVDRQAASIAAAIAIGSGLAAAFQSTFSPAGADASGYLSEARMFASGRLSYTDTLTAIVGGWQTGLTAPLGWLPGAVQGFQTPTYPPGLPLLMAIPHWAGGSVAACWVVIVSAAIAVWSTGRIGLHLAGGAAGIVAAVTLATLPVFLYQSVQPMSDVPVTAAWMLCWVMLVRSGPGLRAPVAAGIACAIAVLIRPNLAPLAIVPLIFTSRRVAFALPVAVAGLFLAWLQWHWYGSPLRSGYGSAGEIFSLANVAPNAAFYARWLLATAPILVLGAIGLWFARVERVTWALASFAALAVGAYLVYAVFEDWSYLRFLLPSLAIGSVFVGVTAARMLAGLPAAARPAVLLITGAAIATAGIANGRALSAFDLDTQHRRIVLMAGRLNGAMAADAVIVAGEQSGSMRYATGHPILRWEAATPADLARALSALQGREVWIVLDGFEHELFRKKFSPAPAGELDWPPAIVAGTRTTAWRLSDRERFARGEHVPTARVP
jgi:hypothetical protein